MSPRVYAPAAAAPGGVPGAVRTPGRGESSGRTGHPTGSAPTGSFASVLRGVRQAAAGSGAPPGGALAAAAPEALAWAVAGPDRLPRGAQGLRWAAGQLEAELWAQFLREALASAGGGPFGAGFAGQVYGDWFSRTLATLVGGSGVGQLAQLLVEEFSGALRGDDPAGGNSGGARGVPGRSGG